MKRTIAILLILIPAVLMLASCGAKSDTAGIREEMGVSSASAGTSYNYTAAEAPAEAPAPAAAQNDAYEDMAGGEMYATGQSVQMPQIPQGGDGMAEKIIYSVNAELETVDFDETIKQVYELIDAHGAFVENSYVGGRSYEQAFYNNQAYRSARFSIRVPKGALNAAAEGLKALGNVISMHSDAQNITAQYVDTESRLATYRTEESRLLAMLGKADTVADMIVIETRLSDVRYQIESLTSSLKNWQNQVDYSTLTIYINEVEKLSKTVPIQRTYWQEIGDGFVETLDGIGEFFTGLFKWIVIELPVLIILAVIITPCVIVVLRKRRVEKKRNSAENEEEK